MTRGILGRALLCAGLLAVWALPAHAQAIGSIFGKVTDSSGAVLPGVSVSVAGTGLQTPLTSTTTESGAYQFPSVPIGTYSVSFELQGFKKAVRNEILITSGFNAGIDQKLEIGQLTDEVTVSSESPVVDLKKTITGAVFTAEVLEKIPTARDPWQIANMTPGVSLSGYNVGGSQSGQQLTPSVRGSTASVQWNLEGGSITDLSSNSSSIYFNFDSFDQIQVTTGGGDVSVQSSGLAINLVTKSGSNNFKGTFNATYENDATQGQNVTEELFNSGAGGFLSGNPLHHIGVYSVEAGGPIVKDKLWYWGSFDKQDINVGIINFFDASKGALCSDLVTAQKKNALGTTITYDNLDDVNKCLSNDQTIIKDYNAKVNYQLNQGNRFGYLFVSDGKVRNHRGASATTQPEATTRQFSPEPWHLPNQTHQLTHTLIASDKLVFNNQVTFVDGGFFLDYQDIDECGTSSYTGATNPADYATGARASAGCLWNTQSLLNRTSSVSQPVAHRDLSDRAADVGSEVGRHLLRHQQAGRRSQPQVRPRLAQGADRHLLALQRRRPHPGAVRRQHQRELRHRQQRPGRLGGRHRALPGHDLPRSAEEQRLVDLQRVHPGQLQPRPHPPERRPPLRLAAVQAPGRLRAGQHAGPDPAAGAVRDRDDERRGHRPEDSVLRQLVPAPVGHLRPVRYRQDIGARQRLVLLRHEDHPRRFAQRHVHPDRADVGAEPVERRVQRHRRRTVLERRQRRPAGAAQ